MLVRVGKVTNVYPETGKVKVLYEDEQNTSMPLSMLTMNGEFSMPSVGEWVVTVHMPNGSSKGFVLGSYYSTQRKPIAQSGYRKELEGGAFIECRNGNYLIYAPEITFSCSAGMISISELIQRLENIENRLREV